MSHVKFMSRSKAAEGTDMVFSPIRCLKASAALKATLYPSISFSFLMLFIYFNRIHRDLAEYFRKRLNPPEQSPGLLRPSAPCCPHRQRFSARQRLNNSPPCCGRAEMQHSPPGMGRGTAKA